MGKITVEQSAVVDAPPDRVYSILADYREGHPRILPKKYFTNLSVEQGGQGAGTILSVTMKVGGRERNSRMEVSEPEPGRVLVERDTRSSSVTTFTVTPEAGGQKSTVRIETEWQGAGGVGGFFERMFAPGMLKKVYAEELELLDQVAKGKG
jgi:uncharacterized protein YndB with AHSA1/START domain